MAKNFIVIILFGIVASAIFFLSYDKYTKGKVSRSNVDSSRNLTCVYFDESKCDIVDKEKCYENVTCLKESEFCFTSWRLLATQEYKDVSPNPIVLNTLSSSENLKVKAMGCMGRRWHGDECQENCVFANEIPKHGHLFCCCTEDFCNSKFQYYPTKLIPHQSSTKSQYSIPFSNYALIIIGAVVIAIVLAVGISARKSQRFGTIPQQDIRNGMILEMVPQT